MIERETPGMYSRCQKWQKHDRNGWGDNSGCSEWSRLLDYYFIGSTKKTLL